MLHGALIALHATTGVLSFAAGALAMRPGASAVTFRVYFWSLVAMLLFLAGAVAVAWPDLDSTTRLVYTGLAVLGAYMLWRANRARTLLARQERGPFLDDIGFTLISLFDAFVIVAAADLGAPGWLVAVVGVVGALAGARVVNRVKARETASRPAT
jgi:CDP-diglyceride synthetase